MKSYQCPFCGEVSSDHDWYRMTRLTFGSNITLLPVSESGFSFVCPKCSNEFDGTSLINVDRPVLLIDLVADALIGYDADAADSAGLRGAIDAVLTERARQDAKWGQQNHDLPYWTSILGEEFGELCQAINETVFDNGAEERAKGGYENMRREAVQVAAVAVAIVEMLDRRYGR